MFVPTIITLGITMIIAFTFIANSYVPSRDFMEEGIAVMKFTENGLSQRQEKILDLNDAELKIAGEEAFF